MPCSAKSAPTGPVAVVEFGDAADAPGLFGLMAEGAESGAYWLDAATRPGEPSAMGVGPAFRLCWGAETGLTSFPPVDWLARDADPFTALRDVLRLYRLPPGTPGSRHADRTNIGYVGYEVGSLLEPTVPGRDGGSPFPDVWWGFYDRAVAIDPADGVMRAVAVDCPLWEAVGLNLPPAADRAAGFAAHLADLIKTRRVRRPPEPKAVARPTGEFTRGEYVRAVARTVEYIRAGDIFQANLSQRFTGPQPLPDWALYLRLREINRAPHSAYLQLGATDEASVLSASPELFLTVDDAGGIVTKPIKGTRRRGRDPAEDAALRDELWNSEKDAAELTMIVDLLRNDVGRVAEYGSVRVAQPRTIESFPTVHHGVATVTARLAPGRDRLDLLAGAFPGGSITGAPKVRAMQIIRELERSRRGVYTGCIGRFGLAGGMDLNIAIRTMTVADGRVTFGVGGGIVADSDPEAEYDETLHKAAGMMRALGAEG
jgi:para-aminobenzoate synthetase component 1